MSGSLCNIFAACATLHNFIIAEDGVQEMEKVEDPAGASNRILSKVQKSFWSCTHVNSCQKYTIYINLHILLNILCKTTSNIQESRKPIKSLKR